MSIIRLITRLPVRYVKGRRSLSVEFAICPLCGNQIAVNIQFCQICGTTNPGWTPPEAAANAEPEDVPDSGMPLEEDPGALSAEDDQATNAPAADIREPQPVEAEPEPGSIEQYLLELFGSAPAQTAETSDVSPQPLPAETTSDALTLFSLQEEVGRALVEGDGVNVEVSADAEPSDVSQAEDLASAREIADEPGVVDVMPAATKGSAGIDEEPPILDDLPEEEIIAVLGPWREVDSPSVPPEIFQAIQVPIAEAAVAEVPIDEPMVEATVAEPILAEAPIVEAPIDELPLVEPGMVESPVADVLIGEAPIDGAPAAEAPLAEPLVVEPALARPEIVEVPIDVAPVAESVVEEASTVAATTPEPPLAEAVMAAPSIFEVLINEPVIVETPVAESAMPEALAPGEGDSVVEAEREGGPDLPGEPDVVPENDVVAEVEAVPPAWEADAAEFPVADESAFVSERGISQPAYIQTGDALVEAQTAAAQEPPIHELTLDELLAASPEPEPRPEPYFQPEPFAEVEIERGAEPKIELDESKGEAERELDAAPPVQVEERSGEAPLPSWHPSDQVEEAEAPLPSWHPSLEAHEEEQAPLPSWHPGEETAAPQFAWPGAESATQAAPVSSGEQYGSTPMASQAPASPYTDPNVPRPKPGTPEYEAMVQRALEERLHAQPGGGQGQPGETAYAAPPPQSAQPAAFTAPFAPSASRPKPGTPEYEEMARQALNQRIQSGPLAGPPQPAPTGPPVAQPPAADAPKPKPGTPEYEAMVQRALDEMRRKREEQQ